MYPVSARGVNVRMINVCFSLNIFIYFYMAYIRLYNYLIHRFAFPQWPTRSFATSRLPELA